MSELIDQALQSATDTKIVVIDQGALSRVADVFTELFADATAIIVGDERTMQVAGNRVQQVLTDRGITTLPPHVFPGEPELYAKYEYCEELRDILKPLDVVAIAVGSGTLNDIVKVVSGELKRPYIVVGTAPSVDGYTSFGASITLNGFKQTLSCPAAEGCVADLDVMAAAPQMMIATGYGDLIGKIPAGADWILADALGVEPIDQSVWTMVQGPLRHSLSRPAELAAGQIDATRDMVEGLVMSGLAMQAHQSSRPASGAEHQFSHLWEMEGHGIDIKPRRLSHGFKVGIGTVAICAFYEALLRRDLTTIDVDAAVAAWPTKRQMEAHVRELHTDPKLVEATVVQALTKWVTPEQLRARLEQLRALWPELSGRLREQLMSPTEVQRALRAVGAPAHPTDIGIDWQRFRDTYTRAQMIRKRYTVLDVALEANLLDEIVEELFSADGFWGSQAQ